MSGNSSIIFEELFWLEGRHCHSQVTYLLYIGFLPGQWSQTHRILKSILCEFQLPILLILIPLLFFFPHTWSQLIHVPIIGRKQTFFHVVGLNKGISHLPFKKSMVWSIYLHGCVKKERNKRKKGLVLQPSCTELKKHTHFVLFTKCLGLLSNN